MAQHIPVEVDKKSLKEAEALWSNFMHVTKYVIVSVVAVLLVLGVAFVF